MKKRLLSILLIGVLSFSLCACGDPATEPTAQTEETEQQTTEEETDTQPTETQPTETEEPQETEETETAQEPENAEEVATEETEAAEETTTPEETETAEATPEQTAEPEYTYTDMSATMYATQTVNIRTAPSTDGEKVGALSTNQEINITGQCNETKWFRFEYNGSIAYVSNNYVSENKIEVAAAEPAPEQAVSSGGGSSAASAYDMTVSQWIDMGDWYYYIHPVYGERPPFSTIDPEYMDRVAILQERYPDRTVDWGHGYDLKKLNASIYFISIFPVSQGYLDGTNYFKQFK